MPRYHSLGGILCLVKRSSERSAVAINTRIMRPKDETAFCLMSMHTESESFVTRVMKLKIRYKSEATVPTKLADCNKANRDAPITSDRMTGSAYRSTGTTAGQGLLSKCHWKNSVGIVATRSKTKCPVIKKSRP